MQIVALPLAGNPPAQQATSSLPIGRAGSGSHAEAAGQVNL
jgi:hypothetical protein